MATTASATKTDLEKNLGADVVIDYQKQAFETALHDYDVVIDTVGGETLDKSLGAEAGRGRHQHHRATRPHLRPLTAGHKRAVRAWVRDLAAAAGAPDLDTLARNLPVSHGSRPRRQHRRSGCDHRLTHLTL
ncbi:zinc-binding dehydrogenase [Streptomyces sp. NPDC005263]|uniref:zinc-binding dehydrogenase n=1 Tax=Streptomyces sp. NPDC005263 TaxID=3364711 RepID=UPI0036CECE24